MWTPAGYNLMVLNSTFMCNGGYGLVYNVTLPVAFTNIGNIYLCNGISDLEPPF